MERQPSGDFVVETNGHCFICLQQIFPNSSINIESKFHHSLQYLSRFLKLDRKKVFIGGEEAIPSHLIENVEKSRLMAGLCEECACINTSFSMMYRQLEKARMKVMSELNRFYEKMHKTDQRDMLEKLSSNDDGLRGKLEVADVLRKETFEKCGQKLSTSEPKVKFEKLTSNAIARLTRTRKYSSYKWDNICNISNISPPIIPSNVKLEDNGQKSTLFIDNFNYDDDDGGDPLNSDNFDDCEQPDFLSKGEDLHYGTNTTPMEVAGSSRKPNIIRNAIVSKSGKFKCRICSKEYANFGSFTTHFQSAHLKIRFQCNLCNKLFTQKCDLTTHQRSVHLKQRVSCKYCSKSFSSAANRSHHLKRCPALNKSE